MKKKTAAKNDSFTASEVGTLIKGFRSEVRIIAENQKAMDDKFTGKFNMLFEEMGRQREDIWILKADVRTIKSDVAMLKEDVSVLKTDMKIVKTDIAEIKEIIGGHDQRIVRLEETCSK